MVKKAFPLLLAAMLLAATPTLAYAAEPPGTTESTGYAISYSENEEYSGSVISVLSEESQAAEPGGGFYPIEIRAEETDGESSSSKPIRSRRILRYPCLLRISRKTASSMRCRRSSRSRWRMSWKPRR